MQSNIQRTVFLLGATGYLGSQFLVSLGRRSPSLQFHVIALVRNLDAQKEARLKTIYPDLSAVEGSLDDADVIVEGASRAKYVVNCASSDHDKSIEAILAGLEKQSEKRPGDPPLYIHVSGLAIVNDNARGELVDEDKIPHYSDIGFSLEQLPPDNPHLSCDALIAAAGIRKQNPIRTIVAYPSWVYGLGEGMTKTTFALRGFMGAFKITGYAGTWGPGYNAVSSVHIKDCAEALLIIFEAAVAGKADEGAEGHYFITSDAPYVAFRDIATAIGDIMFSKGVYKQGGSQPLPPSITDAFGEGVWRALGGNNRAKPQRLERLGWEATETKKVSLLASLPQEIEVILDEGH
ncbi:hypothetical protein GALMADRAFT_227416 [Galerina marginata CBS 339.88]|uniref:NmrA-like domain-containing protein n=1 Tax=Galerina marginata (strain CBS 339.88) TaxID=685588 RepID=A0A067T5Q6_GALM3|nr:hypothetical protein GALMADRAFT_227416 [Galerina marginata CBS 339.88]